MAGQPVNRAIQDAIAIMDILRRKRALEDDPLLEIVQPSRPLQLIEDDLPVRRKHGGPIVMRPQIRRMHQHIQRLAARRRDVRLRCRAGRADVAGRIGRRLASR